MKKSIQLLFALVILSVNILIGQEGINNYANALTSGIWETKSINVCWENPNSSNSQGRAWTKEAVEKSWQKESALNFTGWGTCSNNSEGIRIKIDDSGPHVKALGDHLNGVKDGMVLNFTFNNWCSSCVAAHGLENSIKYIAIHEFGHAISLAHEQNRNDAPNWCKEEEQGTDGDWHIGPFDLNSIMNYCNPKWNNHGELSEGDIQAVQTLYGKSNFKQWHISYAAKSSWKAINSSSASSEKMLFGDFNGDGKDDI